MSEPKQIATLPPLPVLHNEAPLSPRTGEPPRPVLIWLALILLLLAAAAILGGYGHHWWLAVHPDSYPTSAWLIEMVKPDPGKWLALTLEGVLAAATALVAGICAAGGFQAWNGWRWSRWATLAALAGTGGFVSITSWWALIGCGLALAGSLLLFLPPVTKYFSAWKAHRSQRPTPYRRPEAIFYGRLPRYR